MVRKILVQKFGGTSVSDPAHIKRVAKIIADTYREGKDLVVVVSAMGHTTDHLIELARQVNENPDPRELDVLLGTGEQVSIAMLTMALQAIGLKARSYTGPQAGILTDDTHGFARIKTVQASRVENSLRKGEIAVVAGFQGMTRTSELSTLGRGGSDTTAVALAAALKAECCDIYTDVDGIYTTDPRSVTNARKLRAVSYEEMLALASLGAQVLNARSVELAMKNNVAIRLRSTFDPADTGTLVTRKELAPDYRVCGVACDSSRISVRLELGQSFQTVDGEGLADSQSEEKVDTLLERLEEVGVRRNFVIVRRLDGHNASELEFTCEGRIYRQVQSLLAAFMEEMPGSRSKIETSIATISLIGNGVHQDRQLLNELVQVLAAAEIPVNMLSADKLSLSAVVPEKFKGEALRQIHERFCHPTTVNAKTQVLV